MGCRLWGHTESDTTEVKSKGEKERHKHLNAEFQRIARRDKKVFLSDQCKETEENNRVGKRGSALSRLGAELELRRSGSSLGPSQ